MLNKWVLINKGQEIFKFKFGILRKNCKVLRKSPKVLKKYR